MRTLGQSFSKISFLGTKRLLKLVVHVFCHDSSPVFPKKASKIRIYKIPIEKKLGFLGRIFTPAHESAWLRLI